MAATQQYIPPRTPDTLDDTLALVAARSRHQRGIRFAVCGAAVALGIDTGLAYLARAGFLDLSATLFLVMAFCVCVGAGLGATIAARHRLAPMDAARLAETRIPLKERLSSALEFRTASQLGPLLPLQHADAENYARALDARRVVPLRLPRETWLLPALLALLLLALWLPSLPFAETSAQRTERQTVQQTGKALVQAARTLEKTAAARHDPASRAAAHSLEKLGHRMAQGHMSKTDALAALSEEDKKLAAQQSSAPDTDPGQAARALAGTAGTGKPSPSKAAHASSRSPQTGPAPGQTPKPEAASTPHPANAPQSDPKPGGARPGQNAAGNGMHGEPSQPASQPRPSGGSAAHNGTPQNNAQTARQSVENARRQIAQDGSPGTPRPGNAGTPGGQSRPGDGPSASDHPGQSASARSSHSPGGAGSHTQNTSGGAPGSPSPGGGDGKDVKMPFRSTLPPGLPSHGPTLSLGTPPGVGGANVPLPRQSGPPNTVSGASHVPYGTAIPAARRGAEAALDTENVPPSRREAVRDYFDSLQSPK